MHKATNIDCQRISGTVIDRAIKCEILARDYQLVTCQEHRLYHNWVDPNSWTTHNDIRRKVLETRTLGYRLLSDGRTFRLIDSKSKSGNTESM